MWMHVKTERSEQSEGNHTLLSEADQELEI